MTSERQRGGPATAVSTLIEAILSQRGMQGQIQRYRAWLYWDEVVGPQIARHARPLRLRDTLLEVRVDQAAWMQQLQLLKPMIVRKLNEKLGGDLIGDLFLKRGPLPPPPAAVEPARALPALTVEEQQRIERFLTPLRDPALREHLARLIGRDLQQKKSASDR